MLALGILEKDISFGHQGTVSLEVQAALYGYAAGAGQGRLLPAAVNYVGGLGGQDLGQAEIAGLFGELARGQVPGRAGETGLRFLGLEALVDDYD